MFLSTKPIGKERPRINKMTGHFYTPKKTRNFETELALACYEWMKLNKKILSEKAIGLNVVIYEDVPASWTKVRKQEALHGIIRPMKTPDIDNILKSIMDGFQNVLYANDKQVVEFSVKRWYAEECGIMIEPYEI